MDFPLLSRRGGQPAAAWQWHTAVHKVLCSREFCPFPWARCERAIIQRQWRRLAEFQGFLRDRWANVVSTLQGFLIFLQEHERFGSPWDHFFFLLLKLIVVSCFGAFGSVPLQPNYVIFRNWILGNVFLNCAQNYLWKFKWIALTGQVEIQSVLIASVIHCFLYRAYGVYTWR